jgi:antitoxin ParD1/3/4
MLDAEKQQKMPYQIPSDLEQRIQAQIASGQFTSEDDVLREAMDSLERRQRGLEQLRQQVQEADADIVAGRVGPFDAEQTKRNVRERLSQEGITD